jgi:hypothetical protein
MSNSFTGLHPTLIARFYPMTRSEDAGGWIEDRSSGRNSNVFAPLSQAVLELAVNWQSPFEGAGIESSFPGLAQMAQAGMFQGIIKAVGDKWGADTSGAETSAMQLVGRTGVTKLNSTQVFSGMQPAKLQLTAMFKAFRDPKTEVEDPIKMLQMWALPQKLAPDGVLASAVGDWQGMQSLMPSLVPKIIGIEYKNRVFYPFVIESISDPLDSPTDEFGNRIHASLQMSICSLTAYDRDDWAATYKTRSLL